MNNMMNAKEEKLRGRHRDTHTALQWLRQNKHMFEGNVHEPMMLVVRLHNVFISIYDRMRRVCVYALIIGKSSYL